MQAFVPPKPKPKPVTPTPSSKKEGMKAKHMGVKKGGTVVIKGHGDYYTEKVKPFLQKNVPSGSLSKIGSMLGAHLGGPVGAAMGGYGGGRIAKLLGYGDYHVAQNTLSTTGGAVPMGEEIPKFSVAGRGTRIVHREYVGDITSPGAGFDLKSYFLNPTNATLFPWMSTIAGLYQQYKFNGMIFEFKSMSSEYAASSALGTVILTTNYNANLPVFNNKVEMENTEYAVSAKPSLSQIHCIECDPKERVTEYLYVQPNNVGITGISDNRLSSFGNFQLATVGLTAPVTSVIGELWVSYDITFVKPVLNTAPQIPYSITTLTGSVTGASVSTPFGSAPILQTSTFPAFTYSNVAPTTITLPQTGIYLVTVIATVASPNFPGMGIVTSAGLVSSTLSSVSTGTSLFYLLRLDNSIAYSTVLLSFVNITSMTQFRWSMYRADANNANF